MCVQCIAGATAAIGTATGVLASGLVGPTP
jgi:hypothetical protein